MQRLLNSKKEKSRIFSTFTKLDFRDLSEFYFYYDETKIVLDQIIVPLKKRTTNRFYAVFVLSYTIYNICSVVNRFTRVWEPCCPSANTADFVIIWLNAISIWALHNKFMSFSFILSWWIFVAFFLHNVLRNFLGGQTYKTCRYI